MTIDIFNPLKNIPAQKDIKFANLDFDGDIILTPDGGKTVVMVDTDVFRDEGIVTWIEKTKDASV